MFVELLFPKLSFLVPLAESQIQHLIYNTLTTKKYEQRSLQFYYSATENSNFKWKLRWDQSCNSIYTKT